MLTFLTHLFVFGLGLTIGVMAPFAFAELLCWWEQREQRKAERKQGRLFP